MFFQVILVLLQLAFAQHQAEIAKMGQFDNICAEKLSWRESLFGKYLFHDFIVVFKITKCSVIISKNTVISSCTLNLLQQYIILDNVVLPFFHCTRLYLIGL